MLMPKYLITNTGSPQDLRKQSHIAKLHRESEESKEPGRASPKLKYDLDQLFDAEEPYKEEIINFGEVQLDPSADPLLNLKKDS